MSNDTRRDISDQTDVLDLDPVTVLECYRHAWLESLKCISSTDHPVNTDHPVYDITVNGVLGFQAAIESLEDFNGGGWSLEKRR